MSDGTAAAPRHLGILGAGRIGRPLGRHWVRAGHLVSFGARAPDALQSLVGELGPRARATSLEQAAAQADVVLLSVPFAAVDEVLERVGGLLAGKIVIDATNPMGLSPEGRVVSSLGSDLPAGVRLAQRLPHTRVVRAFSHVVHELLETRAFSRPVRAAMALAGDDAAAKEVVARLVRDTGFTPVDLGGLADSSPLDPGGILFAGLFTEADLRARLASLPGQS